MQTNERHRRHPRRHRPTTTHAIPSVSPLSSLSSLPLTSFLYQMPIMTDINTTTRTPDQLARDRALELQRFNRALRAPPPGAMDTIRESTERPPVVEQYALFRERMDAELQQMDLGEPPSQAIDCGISNTRVPQGPSIEDVSQWRTRELHELAVMQREVLDGHQQQNYYHL